MVLKLTHHRMRDLGQQKLNLSGGEAGPSLTPITQVGSGQMQDKHKLRLQEIILAMNDLFEGEITEGDAVAYVDIAGGFELDVVAACVIGGIAIAGGSGTVAGAVMGALFLGIIKNALPVVGISPFWQMAISGSAILLAIAFNAMIRVDD